MPAAYVAVVEDCPEMLKKHYSVCSSVALIVTAKVCAYVQFWHVRGDIVYPCFIHNKYDICYVCCIVYDSLNSANIIYGFCMIYVW